MVKLLATKVRNQPCMFCCGPGEYAYTLDSPLLDSECPKDGYSNEEAIVDSVTFDQDIQLWRLLKPNEE